MCRRWHMSLGMPFMPIIQSNQPLINYHAILPVCETASVFCEMLVIGCA